jgi:D-alanine-D-alanine ligase
MMPINYTDNPKFQKVTVILGDPKLPDRAKTNHRFTAEDLDSVERMQAALAELDSYIFDFHNNHNRLINDLLSRPPVFAVNFCDNGYRNEARHELHIAAFLEMLDIPYSGSGPVALGLCYDKALVRALASAHDIPVAREIFFDNHTDSPPISEYPAFIKPNSADGSVGITEKSLVNNAAEARNYLKLLREQLPGQPVLIQEFLSGTEYGLGLIGNPGQGFTALPILEVNYDDLDTNLPKILSYASKIDSDSPYWTQIKYRLADIDEATRKRLQGYAEILFEHLGLRDYGRFDFRADRNGEIKLMEVNPNPAWCWDGKLNFMAGFRDMNYSELLGLIIRTAQQRYV